MKVEMSTETSMTRDEHDSTNVFQSLTLFYLVFCCCGMKMAFKKAYLVLFCAFLSNMSGLGLRMSMQSPVTKELTEVYNATLVEASWPGTMSATMYYSFCKSTFTE